MFEELFLIGLRLKSKFKPINVVISGVSRGGALGAEAPRTRGPRKKEEEKKERGGKKERKGEREGRKERKPMITKYI